MPSKYVKRIHLNILVRKSYDKKPRQRTMHTRNNIKMDLKEIRKSVYRLYSNESVQGPVVGSCEQGDEQQDVTKGMKFTD
jgi:hypothetical protein